MYVRSKQKVPKKLDPLMRKRMPASVKASKANKQRENERASKDERRFIQAVRRVQGQEYLYKHLAITIGMKQKRRKTMVKNPDNNKMKYRICLLYTSPSPRD